MAGHRDDGSIASDKAHHPNRRVDWDSLFKQTVLDPIKMRNATMAWMNDPDNAPHISHTPAVLSPETLSEFGSDK